MAGWPEPRGSIGISYFWASGVLFPPQGETPESSTEARGVGMVPGFWAPWLVWRPAARGAFLAEMLLVPGLAVLPAGSGRPAALVGVAVTAGECLT